MNSNKSGLTKWGPSIQPTRAPRSDRSPGGKKPSGDRYFSTKLKISIIGQFLSSGDRYFSIYRKISIAKRQKPSGDRSKSPQKGAIFGQRSVCLWAKPVLHSLVPFWSRASSYARGSNSTKMVGSENFQLFENFEILCENFKILFAQKSSDCLSETRLVYQLETQSRPKMGDFWVQNHRSPAILGFCMDNHRENVKIAEIRRFWQKSFGHMQIFFFV